MRKWKKYVAILTAAFLISQASSITSFANEFEEEITKEVSYTVKWQDEEGNEIKDAQTRSGNLYDSVSVTYDDINLEGYYFDELSSMLTIILDDEDNSELILRFKKVQNEEVLEASEVQEEQEEVSDKVEVSISKNMDVSKSSGLSKEEFISLIDSLEYDYAGFFKRNASTIYDLCQKHQINEIFFCGLIAGEAGWDIADNHKVTHNYVSIMTGDNLVRYSSEEKGLEAAAKLLHDCYLTTDGIYYEGKTIAGIQKHFCPDTPSWVDHIYGCMQLVA